MNYAKALVDYGYASRLMIEGWIAVPNGFNEVVDPSADTLEGCHQRTALVNWLVKNHYALWNQSSGLTLDLNNPDMLGYTCDRIEWCFKQLEKQE